MRHVPESVRRGVAAALEDALGRPARVESAEDVGGGCLSQAARVTSGADVFFLKWSTDAPAAAFSAEADGLQALRAAGTVCGLRVPAVLGVGGGGAGEGGPGWLLLEWIPRGAGGPGYGAALGRALAGLHGATREAGEGNGASRATPPDGEGVGDATYGWERGNFIGRLPQSNRPTRGWASFWRDQRLAPQLSLARTRGHFVGDGGRTLDRLLARVEDAAQGADADGPSLLHGDLWSGNVYPGPAGEPVLVDPAVYRGHREVDLAMAELFGGFPPGYLDAYQEAWPLLAGSEVRRHLYQLYYLLVHVNLFGEAYEAGSLAAAQRVLGAL